MMNASCLVRTQFYLFAFFAHIKKEKRRKNECNQGQKLVQKEDEVKEEQILEPVCCKKRPKKYQPKNWFGEYGTSRGFESYQIDFM